ncbi:uncharacterized protein LOC118748364 [Rhagoletis pomonella]|uniref:uncharacterized protein LOC118748364 n=1 Tax=Rhagoletis pomonella TaxID=28610 RepID=UPI00177C13CC|nr:uncharacterized protein LOC118748364 [Rhagoletis pomonella]
MLQQITNFTPLPLNELTHSSTTTNTTARVIIIADVGILLGAKNTTSPQLICGFQQRYMDNRCAHKDEFGTQRVYKKTSPNCVLTLYLPSREITLSGNNPAILRGIIYVDPKAIQGYRVYAQLTLTFRYGREDEEVMGLRFCNEAIMSLHQVWPRNEEPALESLSPLQEALVKRLGDGAHPFTLTLTPQAPPSVQLVPAKRYYGAPIGTSYDVRCFIADKTDEKFHRRASVKMGVRVIYRTDVYNHGNGPENFAALINSQGASPPLTAALTSPPAALTNTGLSSVHTQNGNTTPALGGSCSADSNVSFDGSGSGGGGGGGGGGIAALASTNTGSDRVTPTQPTTQSHAKPKKSERGDSFPKLRLSPKSFRFSGRFGRSKSEIEKCPNDPFYNYSKSFQEGTGCQVIDYADDIAIAATGKHLQVLSELLQNALSLVNVWFKECGLSVNPTKPERNNRCAHKDEFGTQRVYKKTSPNCVLTLYLPSREITLSGNNPAILRGIIYVDPKAIQGYRVYAQLTLTFRYGREDEEVMGLRFCNEAIMSLHQVWPRNEEPALESLSPLQVSALPRFTHIFMYYIWVNPCQIDQCLHTASLDLYEF